jgi:hypothetical protein
VDVFRVDVFRVADLEALWGEPGTLNSGWLFSGLFIRLFTGKR